MRAITVCVGYDDFLGITIPHCAPHFGEWLIVTSLHDRATQALVRELSGSWPLRLHATDTFYRSGATFNKGAALEEGFDVLGRSGWLCVLDADVLLPPGDLWSGLVPGRLYSPYRRMCATLDEWREISAAPWNAPLPVHGDEEHAGYCQLFHAGDPLLAERPWYETPLWTTAQGCDSVFQSRWPEELRVRPVWQVLHLGDYLVNWSGRRSERW